jgi:hypothetical protein
LRGGGASGAGDALGESHHDVTHGWVAMLDELELVRGKQALKHPLLIHNGEGGEAPLVLPKSVVTVLRYSNVLVMVQ